MDVISYSIYGDASYYWTIILINNIQDTFFDLPLSQEELRLHVIKKMELDGIPEDEISDRYYQYYIQAEEENNLKRNILVVRPEFINTFVSLVQKA